MLKGVLTTNVERLQVRLLLRHGAQTVPKGGFFGHGFTHDSSRVLIAATATGRSSHKILHTLLHNLGTDSHVATCALRAALRQAISGDCLTCINLIAAHPLTHVQCATLIEGSDALSLTACAAARGEQGVPALLMLLKHGVTIESSADQRWPSPLWLAVLKDAPTMLELLLVHGPSAAGTHPETGLTLLQHVAKHNMQRCARKLVQHPSCCIALSLPPRAPVSLNTNEFSGDHLSAGRPGRTCSDEARLPCKDRQRGHSETADSVHVRFSSVPPQIIPPWPISDGDNDISKAGDGSVKQAQTSPTTNSSYWTDDTCSSDPIAMQALSSDPYNALPPHSDSFSCLALPGTSSSNSLAKSAKAHGVGKWVRFCLLLRPCDAGRMVFHCTCTSLCIAGALAGCVWEPLHLSARNFAALMSACLVQQHCA